MGKISELGWLAGFIKLAILATPISYISYTCYQIQFEKFCLYSYLSNELPHKHVRPV